MKIIIPELIECFLCFIFLNLFLKSFFGFGQTAEISIELADSDKRKQVEIKNEDDRREKHFLYYDGETVSGTVSFDSYLYHPII